MTESNTARHIARFGWTVIKVFDDELPSFAYTIGLWERFGHPELLMSGLPLADLHVILNVAGAAVRDGARFAAGTTTTALLEEHRCGVRTIPDDRWGEYLGAALRHYGRQSFPALQLLWPDGEGRLPGEPGCDAACVLEQELTLPSSAEGP